MPELTTPATPAVGPPAAHDLGGAEHNADTLANLNAKVSDATLIDTADARLSDARTPLAHDLAGAEHNADTLADLNTKISDATLDDSAASRPPSGTAAGDLGGTYPNPAVAQASGAFALNGVISDTIAAQADDYAPSGIATASVIRVTLTGAQVITGIAGGVAGRILIFNNVDEVDVLTFNDEDAASVAANRIIGPGGANRGIGNRANAILQYDGVSSRWRILAST